MPNYSVDDSEYAFDYSKQYQPVRRVESSYALGLDQPVQEQELKKSVYFLETKNSDYALPMSSKNPINVRGNYHYVSAEELAPLPAYAQNKGQLCTRTELLSRVQRLEPGFYLPVIAGGQLHFLSSSDDDTRTAHGINSVASLNTAASKTSLKSAKSADLVTARSNKSMENPQTARIAGSDVKLNAAFLSLKRITPSDIAQLAQIPGFRQSLTQFKAEKVAQKAKKSAKFEEMSNQEYNERLSLQTAMETPSLMNVHTAASKSGPRTARGHSELEPVDFSEFTAQSGSETLIDTGRANSFTNLATGRQNSYSNLATGRQNSYSNLATGRQNSYSNLATGRTNSYSNLAPGRSNNLSNLATGRQNSHHNLATGRSNSQANLAAGRSRSQSNLATGRANSYSNLATGRQNSYSNLVNDLLDSIGDLAPGKSTSHSNLVTGRANSYSNLATGRENSYHNLATGRRNNQANLAHGSEGSEDKSGLMLLETGRQNSYSNLRTGRSNSNANLNAGQKTRTVSVGSDVDTAHLPISVEESQLLESLDELKKIAAHELRSNASALTAREYGSVTENLQGPTAYEMTNTPQNFDPRATQSGVGEPIKLSRNVEEPNLRTATENKSFS